MFNLIITIISIALVAALAVATIYYGGAAFSQGSARANAATLVSHAQQITAANTLYANASGGSFATNIADLVSNNYLGSIPTSSIAAAYAVDSNNQVTTTLSSGADQVCLEVDKTLDSTVNAVPTSAPAKQYGCWKDTANGNALKFFYKG
jgi:hypothetical protein